MLPSGLKAQIYKHLSILTSYHMLLCDQQLLSREGRLDGVEALAHSSKYSSALFYLNLLRG